MSEFMNQPSLSTMRMCDRRVYRNRRLTVGSGTEARQKFGMIDI